MAYSRESSVIDAYQPPDNIKDWETCPDCKQKPWTWIFDNGSFAKCCCDHKWSNKVGWVESESVGDVYRRDGNAIKYDRDKLRRVWNASLKH